MDAEPAGDFGLTQSAHVVEARDLRHEPQLVDARHQSVLRIRARATDETGRVQPQIPWNYQRKHFDGIVPTDVTIS